MRYSANASSDHQPSQVPGTLKTINPKQPTLPIYSIISTALLFQLFSKPSLHLTAKTMFGIIITTMKTKPNTLNHSISVSPQILIFKPICIWITIPYLSRKFNLRVVQHNTECCDESSKYTASSHSCKRNNIDRKRSGCTFAQIYKIDKFFQRQPAQTFCFCLYHCDHSVSAAEGKCSDFHKGQEQFDILMYSITSIEKLYQIR